MRLIMIPVARSGGRRIELNIDDGEAQLTQGFGGWETVARPQRVAITRFGGNEPIGQSVPVLLDGYRGGRSVEKKLRSLLRQSRSRPGQIVTPTIWKLRGPIYFKEKQWVISGIEFGDVLRTPRPNRYNTAALTRQRAVISFLEYVPPDAIRVKRVRRTYKPQGDKKEIDAKGRSIKQITAQFYETSEIAVARALGKAQKPPIRDIKKKQGKRKIRLPVLKV